MVDQTKIIILLSVFLLAATQASPQKRLSILDMNMHARTADHCGPPPVSMLDDLLALLFNYPRVYVEVRVAVNVEPRPAFYRFLKGNVNGDYDERVMFGTDQMVWAGVIEPAVESIEQAAFLTARQKRDIFYNNAARFLRLSKQEIARHHNMQPPHRNGNKAPRAAKAKRTPGRL